MNGLVDQAQKGAFASSAVGVAESIGLPPWFVELRHSATHDKLPSLVLLRSGRNQALDWLFHNYWKVQQVLVKNLGVNVTDCLGMYKEAMKKRIADGVSDDSAVIPILKDITEMLSEETYIDVLLPIIIQPGFLVPLSKK